MTALVKDVLYSYWKHPKNFYDLSKRFAQQYPLHLEFSEKSFFPKVDLTISCLSEFGGPSENLPTFRNSNDKRSEALLKASFSYLGKPHKPIVVTMVVCQKLDSWSGRTPEVITS